MKRLSLVIVFLFAISCSAQEGHISVVEHIPGVVTLTWDANPPEEGVEGYRVYMGMESRVYTSIVDVGNYTTLTVSDVMPGTYFAATAYRGEEESDYSDEVMYEPGTSG